MNKPTAPIATLIHMSVQCSFFATFTWTKEALQLDCLLSARKGTNEDLRLGSGSDLGFGFVAPDTPNTT
jgi:hypothetical protein